MLADIYSADSSYTYQVGGYSGDDWTYNYTRTLENIFSDGTEFDNSILISGNIDCDLFVSINNQRYEYMMVVKDSESSSPNYRKMIVDPAFDGYEEAKLLGSCLIQSGNWSSFSVYNLTQMKPVIGAEMKGARFCLGNKTSGFKKLTLFPVNMSVEKQPPEMAGSTTTYAAINYINTTTLEDIQNKTLQSSGFDIKHSERGATNTTNYTFESNHRPILTFVIKYNDDILLVNAAYLISKGDGGYISAYQNGIPVSHAFGKVINDPEFIQMCTDVTKPQWVARPHLGDVPENDLGLYCQVYASRSTWYLNQHMLYNGAIVRRLLTISGLFFLWDSAYAGTGASTTAFNENLCLGSRDEYGQIKQDGYNKGWTDIVKNDEYYDKLDYKDMPTVNPNPPKDDDDYPDDKSDNIPFGGAYAGLGAFAKFYLCSGLTIAGLSTWINGRDPSWPEGFDPMNQIIGLSRFATDLSSASYGSTTIKFHTADGTAIDTRLSALHGNGDNIELDLGSVDIPLRMEDRGIPFLDYSSTVELYIPACGIFQLDPQTILGSTLSVKMWLSTATGECNAIAYVNRGGANNPVAYGSGSLAVPMPISSNGWGAYQAALTNVSIKESFGAIKAVPAVVEGIKGLIVDVSGIGTSASTAIGTLQSVAQADADRQHVKNSSYTSVSGSFGSTAAWNYPFNAYIKITRPRYRKPQNYGHTQGIPLVATKTLSDCSGYTICVGTDVSSINATVNEKNQIISFLSSGVIV